MKDLDDILEIIKNEKSITFVINKHNINDIEFIKIIINKLNKSVYIRDIEKTSNTDIFGSDYKSNIIFLFSKKLKIIRKSLNEVKIERIITLNNFIRQYKLEVIENKKEDF